MSYQQWFEVYVHSAGYIEQHEHYGFDVLRAGAVPPRYQRDLAHKVCVIGGDHIYVSGEVARALIDTRFYDGSEIRFGRRAFHQVNDKFKAEAMRGILYPARNKREQQVKDRNFELLAWLESLAGEA